MIFLLACVHNKVRLYADDVLLFSCINSKADYISLQQDLTALEQWSLKWQMLLNPAKCRFLRITNKKNRFIYNYYIGSSPIQEVTSLKYLGVRIDHKLTWNDHIQYIYYS